jgi:hypothetical protein
MPSQQPERRGGPIHAVIGVRYDGRRTLYVKRSDAMENYPGVWSLLSVQFDPGELPGLDDLVAAQRIFDRLSFERLGALRLRVERHIVSGTCSDNPMGRRVVLHLYAISYNGVASLNPRYYSDQAWLTPSEYEQRAAGMSCGLCLRLWSDYSFRHGLAPARFAPIPVLDGANDAA